jgi:glycosyltransferase involved in cell wall biosynthesis
MRILIDLQCCQSGSRFGGIGRYSMSLAKAMLRLPSPHRISLLLNGSLPNENFIRAEFADLLPQQDIHTFLLPPFVAADNELPAHTRIAELIREKHIAEIAPDVLHIASLFEGAGENVVTSVGLLFPAARTAVTLYDLIPFLEQETYLDRPVLADHYLRKFAQLQTAGALVSISEFSRQEALEHTSIAADRIVNISSAVDGEFAPRQVGEPERTLLLRKCGIDKPFVMFTGSFDARKNHVRLVKAFAKVLPALAEPVQLVIVGKGLARQIARLKAIARYHGLADGDLVFVGHVTDAELIALYNLARLFVFPSLREGFGLPVLEAMSCGLPTIGSNRTSVPEVIARADALFDPRSVDDMADRMRSVLSDAALRDELRVHGLEQARNFSWELSARRALQVFERLLAGSPGPAIVADMAGENPLVYADFQASVARLPIGAASHDFLVSCARTIAANEVLARVGDNRCRAQMRAGWVTSWAAGCDVAASARALMGALPSRPILFASRGRAAAPLDDTPAIWCWEPLDSALQELEAALGAANIDVVMVEAGDDLFQLGPLARLVASQKQLGRQVFVTFHSTESFRRVEPQAALEIRTILKSCDGIFVHAMRDVANLEAFKLRRNVSIVPPARPGRAPDSAAAYLIGKMVFALAAARLE